MGFGGSWSGIADITADNMMVDLIEPVRLSAALVASFVVSAVLSAVLIVLLMPLLRRYALARPNARSSHRIPTPQGGGMAVVAAALVPLVGLDLFGGPDPGAAWGGGHGFHGFRVAVAATVALACLGAVDDI